MPFHKIFPNQDIVYGASVNGAGGHPPQTYDDPNRTVHIPNTGSIAYFDKLDKRYIYHGGAGGSGYWEH